MASKKMYKYRLPHIKVKDINFQKITKITS